MYVISARQTGVLLESTHLPRLHLRSPYHFFPGLPSLFCHAVSSGVVPQAALPLRPLLLSDFVMYLPVRILDLDLALTSLVLSRVATHLFGHPAKLRPCLRDICLFYITMVLTGLDSTSA